MLVRVTFLIVKNQHLSVKLCVLTEFVLKAPFFDKRCNELEVWLKERDYSDKLVRAQILKVKKEFEVKSFKQTKACRKLK